MTDPDHPDLGPRNNQFVFLAGRIQPGRDTFAQRFANRALGSVNWFNHTSICELSHHIAFSYATAQYAQGKWHAGPNHLKPNYSEAEFVIFWGTGAFEANFGPTPLTEQITDSLVQRNFRFAVIDPRLSKTAAKAWKWLPVQPGGDLPLALAMIRWIFENKRYSYNGRTPPAERGSPHVATRTGKAERPAALRLNDRPGVMLVGGSERFPIAAKVIERSAEQTKKAVEMPRVRASRRRGQSNRYLAAPAMTG